MISLRSKTRLHPLKPVNDFRPNGGALPSTASVALYAVVGDRGSMVAANA